MAVLGIGSLWTSNTSGHVYEIVATSPDILYSPVVTYSTTIANARIFARKADDFLSRFTDSMLSFNVTYLNDTVTYNGQIVTRTPA